MSRRYDQAARQMVVRNRAGARREAQIRGWPVRSVQEKAAGAQGEGGDVSIDDADKEMSAGFGAALAMTEEAVSETLEQMALPPLPVPTGTQYGHNRSVIGHTYTADQMRAYAIAARRLLAEQEQEQVICNHEPFEGRCVHCNIRFIDGEPTIQRAAPPQDEKICVKCGENVGDGDVDGCRDPDCLEAK